MDLFWVLVCGTVFLCMCVGIIYDITITTPDNQSREERLEEIQKVIDELESVQSMLDCSYISEKTAYWMADPILVNLIRWSKDSIFNDRYRHLHLEKQFKDVENDLYEKIFLILHGNRNIRIVIVKLNRIAWELQNDKPYHTKPSVSTVQKINADEYFRKFRAEVMKYRKEQQSVN